MRSSLRRSSTLALLGLCASIIFTGCRSTRSYVAAVPGFGWVAPKDQMNFEELASNEELTRPSQQAKPLGSVGVTPGNGANQEYAGTYPDTGYPSPHQPDLSKKPSYGSTQKGYYDEGFDRTSQPRTNTNPYGADTGKNTTDYSDYSQPAKQNLPVDQTYDSSNQTMIDEYRDSAKSLVDNYRDKTDSYADQAQDYGHNLADQAADNANTIQDSYNQARDYVNNATEPAANGVVDYRNDISDRSYQATDGNDNIQRYTTDSYDEYADSTSQPLQNEPNFQDALNSASGLGPDASNQYNSYLENQQPAQDYNQGYDQNPQDAGGNLDTEGSYESPQNSTPTRQYDQPWRPGSTSSYPVSRSGRANQHIHKNPVRPASYERGPGLRSHGSTQPYPPKS